MSTSLFSAKETYYDREGHLAGWLYSREFSCGDDTKSVMVKACPSGAVAFFDTTSAALLWLSGQDSSEPVATVPPSSEPPAAEPVDISTRRGRPKKVGASVAA